MSIATQGHLHHHNTRLIQYCLEKCYPDGIITVEKLLADNLINGTQVAEMAVCRTNGKVEMCPIRIGRDLTDDSDVKTVTVQANKKKTWLKVNKERTGKFNISISHRAQVKDIANKIGKLRVICYNPFTEGWKFFVVPQEGFHHLKKLTFTFNKETGETIGIHRIHEVSTWEELCKN